jgi:hypothetical protein
MLMGSTGEPASAVGDRFTIHMDRDALRDIPLEEYDSEVVITEYEPDARIEWTVEGSFDPPLDHRYGYALEATDDGTKVTTWNDWSRVPQQYRDMGFYPPIDQGKLRATLGILARTVAPGRHRPGAATAP